MTRREWRDLGIVLGVALTLRLALWWLLPRQQWVSDEPEYMAAAYWLAHGRGFSFYAEWPWLRPPVYLLFLAPFLRFFGLELAPIRAAQLLVSLSVPALTYLLGRATFGPRAARLAGLLAALWLPLAVLPHLVLAENLFLPLLLAGFLCLVRTPSAAHPARWAAAGGALLGLATLTRGLTVAFLPAAAGWLLIQGWKSRPGVAGANHPRARGAGGESAAGPPPGTGARRERGTLRACGAALLFAGTAALVILPWTGYNSLRYGRLILVDTTGGYNFWLGTEGGQFPHVRDVHQALLEQPDPAARQTYAYRQGLAAIAADPLNYLRTRGTELGQLLRINYSADERLVDGFVLGQVSIPHLLALFLLEDSLYILLVPLAIAGLLLHRGEAGRGLTLLWLAYNLAVALAFFAINRFRLPLMPFLMVYAAAFGERPFRGPAPPGAKAEEPAPGEDASGERKMSRSFWPRFVAALGLGLAFWVVALPSYAGPYPASAGATILGVRGRVAAGYLARAEEALAQGERDAAREALQPALAFRPDGTHPLGTAQVVLAAWQRAGGDAAGALRTLQGVDWYQAALLRGDILREQGDLDGARREFGDRQVIERDALPWAWEHLQPPAVQAIDVGGGLDLGLVDGFYAPEREGEITYRWSGATARLRFPGVGYGRQQVLRLHLRGWRPAGEPPAEVRLLVRGVEVGRFTLGADWQVVAAQLPISVGEKEQVEVTLETAAFLAGPPDLLQTGRLRMLGVMVDGAQVVAVPER